jgi:hypothetical protein
LDLEFVDIFVVFPESRPLICRKNSTDSQKESLKAKIAMKGSTGKISQLKKPENKEPETTGGKTMTPPAFSLKAGGAEGEGNAPVAKLKLHSDTETVDRTKLTFSELQNAQVGHSWVSLEYNDPTAVPDEINPLTKALLQAGYASFGFWPLINRTGDMTYPDDSQQRVDAGLTPGNGTSNDTAHRGFSLNPFKWVPGRVEEPDLAHAPKGTVEYSLNLQELKNMLAYVEGKKNANYNLYRFNCTTFAVDAVKAAGKSAPGGSMLGVCLPNALYADMDKMSKKGDKSVTLAPEEPAKEVKKPEVAGN